jgi:hypothetical protein
MREETARFMGAIRNDRLLPGGLSLIGVRRLEFLDPRL